MIASLLTRRNLLILFHFSLVIFGLILGKALVEENYYIMLGVATLVVAALIYRSNTTPIIIMLFIVFFGNWVQTVGLLPPQFSWLSEVLIALLFVKAISAKILRKEKIHLKYLGIVCLFLFITGISFRLTGVSMIHMLLFLRLLFRHYILFIAVINLDFTEKEMNRIIKLLIFLFIIQIPTAVGKMFVYGPGEMAIGTYAPWGGGPSAIIPLIAIGFLLSLYFLYKPSKWYVLLAFGFIAFGIIGGKRAVLFFVPVIILFLAFFMKIGFKEVIKYAMIGGVIILVTGFFSIRFLRSLNPEGGYGNVTVDLRFVADYIANYTTDEEEGKSKGRISTTINVFRILNEQGTRGLLLGLGPGSYIKTRFEDLKSTQKEMGTLPIIYGITGFTWTALQTGFVGALVYFSVFLFILIAASKYYKTETRPYWKAFALGMVGYTFVMLWINVTYWTVHLDDMLPLVYFLLVAFMLKKTENSEIPSDSKI